MRNSIFVLLLLLISFSGKAQDVNRSLLRGKVVSDSLQVENITVRNSTSEKMTVTDKQGNFSLYAKEKDTLVFSGVAFKSSVLIVSHSHLVDEDLKIRLEVRINELDELIVRPYTLTGNLETDTKKIKVKTIDLNLKAIDFSAVDIKIDPVNTALRQAMGTPGNNFNGIDFAKLGQSLYKIIFKPKPKEKRIEYVTEKIFSEAVKEKFTPSFFTGTLKLKPEEVDLFLAFCDETPLENRGLLNPKKEFELIDFLLKKSEEYLKKNR
ncbi:carboxypeptidase-like regulatory domain-containing protein [Flavobacterium pedocola]